MSELQTRLHDYFDDVVERVSAQDVIAQVRVRQQPRFRGPVWAAANAAAAVIVGVGSVVVAHWLLRGGPRRFRSSHQATAAATQATSWVWPVLIGIAAAFTIGAIALVVLRRTRRGKVMETIGRTADVRAEPARSNRRLIVTLAVLLVVALAAIVWLLVAPPGPSVPTDVQAVLDDYSAAWNAHDGEAVLTIMGAGIHTSSAGEFSGGSLASLVNSLPSGWTITRIGRPLVVEMPFGQATRYVIVVPELMTMHEGIESTATGVSVYKIVRDTNAEVTILSHEWIGQ